MKIISHTVINSTTQNVDLTSIPQTYTHLYLVFNGRGSASADWFCIGLNGDHTGTNYRSQSHYRDRGSSTTSPGQQTPNSGELPLQGVINYSNSLTNSFSSAEVYLYNYTRTDNRKTYSANSGQNNNQDPARVAFWETSRVTNENAITAIRLQCQSTASNSFVAGTTITLYGIA